MNKRSLYKVLSVFVAFLMLQVVATTSECSVTSINNRIISSPIDGCVYNFRFSRALENGWPVAFKGIPISNVAACEMDDDINTTEYAFFIKVDENIQLAILTEDGKQLISSSQMDFTPTSDPLIIKTGLHERTLVGGGADGRIHASLIDNISNEVWSKTIDDGKPVFVQGSDVNGDGMEEIIAASGKGKLELLKYSAPIWESSSINELNQDINISPALIDVNKDGLDELIVASASSILQAFSIDKSGFKAISWSANIGEPPTSICMTNGNIVCRSANNNMIIIGPDGTIMKKQGFPVTNLGTELMLYSANKGLITESGPFHHFEQPDDQQYYIPPVYYSPNGDWIKDEPDIPDALMYAVEGRSSKLPTYEVIYAELETPASYMGDDISAPRKIILDTISPSIESFYVTNKIFSPNSDGYNDQLKIKLKLSEKCDLHVKYTDKNGKTIKEEAINNIPAFPLEYAWDGKDDKGNINEGTFIYKIFVQDYAGNKSQTISGEVTIDMTPYLILVGVSPEAVSNTRYNAEPIRFNMKVFTPCTLEAYIAYNSSPVRTLIPQSNYSPGEYQLAWNGKNNSQENLAEGNYSYIFSALYKDLSSSQNGIVRVDNTKPYVTQIAITPEEISDRSTGACLLSYYLSESCYVNIDIIDPLGHMFSNIISGDVQDAKARLVTFDSSKFSDKGVYSPGTYTVRFKLKDEAGNENMDETLKLQVVSGLNIINVNAVPSIFTPNNDNHDDFVTIQYSISGAEQNITSKVTIKTIGGSTVRTFINMGRSGMYSESWDGRDEEGNPSPDGQYTYEISADEDGGTSAAKQTGELTLVREQTITIYADPKEFSPNGDNIVDITKIYYTINYKGKLIEGDSSVQINIYAPDRTKVYYFSDTKPEGSYFHIWNASNNIVGGICPDAIYKLEIRANDPTGTIYSYVADLIVDRGPPDMEDWGPTVSVITPNGDGQYDDTTIQYRIIDVGTQIKSGELNIYNSATSFDATTLVRTLNGNISGGTLWDGRVNNAGGNGDADGNGYADTGKYKYTITASDVLGNIRTYVSTYEIQVDKVWITLVSPPLGSPSNAYISPNRDGIKDSTLIRFQLTTSSESRPLYLMSIEKGRKIMALTNYYSGKVTVKVKDMVGTTIKTLMNALPCYVIYNGQPATYEVIWDGTDVNGTKVSDNPYTIEVTAVDMIGYPATNSINPIIHVDVVSPEVSFTTPAENSWQSGTIDLYGNVTDNISQDCYLVFCGGGQICSGEGSRISQKLGTFNTTGINSDIAVSVIATDEAGNTSVIATRHLNIDNTPPVISVVTSEVSGVHGNSFNPYIDNCLTIETTLIDNSYSTDEYPNQGPAHNITMSAEVFLGNTLIKQLGSSSASSNASLSSVWDGKNLNGDYVNEGEYTVKILAVDSIGNTANIREYNVKLADDQQLTNNEGATYSHDPLLSLNGTNLLLDLIAGESRGNAPQVWTDAYSTSSNGTLVTAYDDFCIDRDQALTVRYRMASSTTDDLGRYRKTHVNLYDETFAIHYPDERFRDTPFYVDYTFQTYIMPAGRYKTNAYAIGEYHDLPNGEQSARAQIWVDYKLDQYNRETSCNISGVGAWSPHISIAKIKLFESCAAYNGGAKTHKVFYGKYYVTPGNVSHLTYNNEIIYSPGEQRISNGDGDSINQAITTSSDGKRILVVWEDWRSGKPEIYIRISIDEGASWLPEKLFVSSLPWENRYPNIAMNGNHVYVSYIDTSSGAPELYIKKSNDGGSSWSLPARITRNVFMGCVPAKSSLAVDASGNGCIAWEDSRRGQKEIFFQKIPSNFAPFSGSGMTTLAIPQQSIGKVSPIILSGTSTIELISPIGRTTVKSLRPTFRWYGVAGWKDYRVECATTSEDTVLSGSLDYFTTTISDVSSPKPICEYLVPEHSMGLVESDSSRPFWYWRVKTVNTSEVTTSEVGSFRIELPLSLSGVTNWPNPFDPANEKTKIRYRLGREPDSVTIRIYDITGALVRELDGTCNAEGASIWNKYNDVEWDGRNGRGDIVLNGVYPFEVIVEGGNKTVSGRGKIVVLK